MEHMFGGYRWARPSPGPETRHCTAGVGVMGAEHARRLTRVIGGASVSGVTDFAGDRAEALAAELGARVLGSAEELIDADDVDAVVIASRDADHSAQVMSCLAHRKPVLCEKPLAPTLAECRAVVDAQTVLALPHPLVSVGFMRGFAPPTTNSPRWCAAARSENHCWCAVRTVT